MGVQDILGSIFSGGADKILKSAGDILDDVITNKEELAEAKLKLEQETNRAIETSKAQAMQEVQMYIDDVASARTREIELAKAGAKDKTPAVLAYIAVIGFLGIVVFLMIHGIGTLDREVVLLLGGLIGILGANSQTVYNYFFGSSAGSKASAQRLDDLTKQVVNDKPKT